MVSKAVMKMFQKIAISQYIPDYSNFLGVIPECHVVRGSQEPSYNPRVSPQ